MPKSKFVTAVAVCGIFLNAFVCIFSNVLPVCHGSMRAVGDNNNVCHVLELPR